MFTNQDLKKLIIPLFLEQLLVMLVGVCDTFIISFAGEAAVSGVSLVNSFNTIFIFLFTALAAGGAVIISQYIGKGAFDSASESSSQLLTVSALFSGIMAVLTLLFDEPLMRLMFGRVEPEVMEACIVYLRISACSYPAMAIYNAGAALYRSIGKTSVTMYISIVANIINVIGNIIGVFILDAGVAGVAWPSLIARVFSALVITVLCFGKAQKVRFSAPDIFQWNRDLMKRILAVAIPNGIENGVFQLVKVALSSVVALFGTYQIAANGVAQSIWSLAALVGVAMGPVYITVIGQCMGSGNISEAQRYMKKLTIITICASALWNGFIFAITPMFMGMYALEQQTKDLILQLVLIHNLFNSFAFPLSNPFSNGLRAAGDVTFTVVVAIGSTIVGRLVMSMVFAIVLQMGVIGIAYAMCLDWIIRGAAFLLRYRSGKWKNFQLI